MRANTYKYVMHFIQVRAKLRLAKLCCLVGGRLYGNYLISAYLFVKSIYVANAVGQLFLLDAILGIDYHMYGFRVVEKLVRGKDWSIAECFPRVTLCDFAIRHQARLHSYVVQCVLTINLFNEKLFIFVWFWFVFVAILSVGNMLHWIYRALYWPAQVRYVAKQLRAFDAASSQREPGTLIRFTEDYLRRDGLFLVRLVAMNMGDVVAAEVLTSLWHNYGPERRAIAEKSGNKRQHPHPFDFNHKNGGNRTRTEVV
jgi:hypothetical protein